MKINFRTKLTIGFDLVLILISALIINFFYSKAHYVQRDNLRSRLIGIAATASLMIEGDKHDFLQEPSHMEHPLFEELKSILTRIREANPGITYIYTMRRTDDPNTFEFVIDEAEEIDENEDGVIDDEESSAELGEPYDVSTYPELRAAYDGPRADRVLQSDKWGNWLSGYAPIFNSKLEPVGILGIDMAADDVKAEEEVLTYTALILLGLAIIGSILAGSLLAHHFTEPIKKLLGAIHKIAQGDLRARIDIKRSDEIGELGRAFNMMAENLDASRKELDEYNRLLEERVRERTRKLKEAQDAVIHSKKMAAVGALAGGVAHEFNNIFAALRGSAELAMACDDPELTKEALELTLQMSDRAKEITTALTAHSIEGDLARKDIIRLNDLVEFSISLYESDLRKLKITVSCDLNPLPEILGHREQIQHALTNIITNAMDAMTESGGILMIITRVSDGSALIRISDTGAGIDPEKLDEIFDPFRGDKGILSRGKEGYAGLGLFIASGIIKNHGGEIRVESVPGKGATFTVAFPLPSPEKLRECRPEEAAEEDISGERVEAGKILLVDDEKQLVNYLQRYLQGRGFETEVAFNGHEAVRKARQNDYDVIFMDIAMPDMDGETAMEKILQFRPNVQFVVISGFSPYELSGRVLNNVSAFLQKPFTLPRVEIEALRAFSRKGRTPSPGQED